MQTRDINGLKKQQEVHCHRQISENLSDFYFISHFFHASLEDFEHQSKVQKKKKRMILYDLIKNKQQLASSLFQIFSSCFTRPFIRRYNVVLSGI